METESYRPSRLILLGADASPELRRATSLDALVTQGSPPFFIWHTAEDSYVPPERTYRLARALAASGVPHTVHVFAHGPHSLGLARGAGDAAIWTSLADAWIHDQPAPERGRLRLRGNRAPVLADASDSSERMLASREGSRPASRSAPAREDDQRGVG